MRREKTLCSLGPVIVKGAPWMGRRLDEDIARNRLK